MTSNETLDGPPDLALGIAQVLEAKGPLASPQESPEVPVIPRDESKELSSQETTSTPRPDAHSSSHIENSPGAKSEIVVGHHNVRNETNLHNETIYIQYFRGDGDGQSLRRAQLGGKGQSLFDISMPLGTPCSRLRLDDYHIYLDKLWDSRLVMVSCADEEIGHQAARDLIDGLGFPDAHKRLLSLGREDEEINNLDVISFVKTTTKAEQRTGVLVSAFRDVTQTFLDSLFSVYGEWTVQRLLEENELFIVCVAEPGQVRSKVDFHRQGFRFPLWEIHFLRPLLQRSVFEDCEDVERLIQGQRQRGCWNKDEVKFAFEVRQAITADVLLDKIRSFEASSDSVASTAPNDLFKGDDPVRDTVVFTATHFPGLTPVNFMRVVEALLRDRTMPVNSPSLKPGHEDALDRVEMQKEMPLVDVWRDSADKIMTQCQIDVISGPDSTKVVEFRDQRMREQVRHYLESNYSFYLEKQMERIRLHGLMFDPSIGIGERATQFILDRAIASPDDFDKDWLVEILSSLERPVSPRAAVTDPGSGGGSSSPGEPYGRKKGRAYTRIAELMRAMLEDGRLNNKVNEVLEHLMIARMYGGVLQITRRLRFAPSFDDFHWMRQLFERGDQQCRDESFGYLLSYMKRMESNIYQKLAVLKTWLPEEGHENLPQVSLSALNLVMSYCVDATLSFASENYGAWPSRFPLFAGKDRDGFETNLKLLVEWLFHPAMKKVEESSLVGLVIAVWTFILRGPPDKSSKKAKSQSVRRRSELQDSSFIGTDSTFDSAAVLELLLKHVASSATADDRRTLIRDWQQMIQYLFGWIDEVQPNNSLRKELVWQRNQIRDLIRQFKEAIKAAGSTPQQVTA